MASDESSACPLHGAGVTGQSLVGRRAVKVVASGHVYRGDDPAGPLEVWLIDEEGVAVRITTGSDWCLIAEESEPHAGYDMGDSGLVTVGAIRQETPFADHIGESVLAVREDHVPNAGRVALELSFPTGGVRCESWAGDLRLSATGRHPGSPT